MITAGFLFFIFFIIAFSLGLIINPQSYININVNKITQLQYDHSNSFIVPWLRSFD